MDLRALALSHAAAWALAACRIGAWVASSPFPGSYVSATQRVGLVVVLALFAGPLAAPPRPLPLDPSLAGSVLAEVACGVVMGLAFRLVFSAADVLGQGLSQATGLSSPTALNPTLEAPDGPLSRAATLLALLVALGAGAHRVALAYLLESFRVVPLGAAPLPGAVAWPFVDLAAAALAAGVRLALPALAVAIAVQLALALVARAAPALQLFSVGLSVLVASGLAVAYASLGDMGRGLAGHFATLGPALDRALRALAAP